MISGAMSSMRAARISSAFVLSTSCLYSSRQVPFGPEVQYSSEKPWDELEIRVYPGADGKFTLYEDEGDNYNYEKGKFSEIQFVWNEAGRTLNIAPRKGSYKGMLQHRKFHIVLVGANSGAGDQPMQASESVEYDGKAVKIQL